MGLCKTSPLTPLLIQERGTKGVRLDKELKQIQTNLFIIGSILAGSKKHKFRSSETVKLEKLIDKLTLQLPKISNFVYPIGYLQIARAVARRAEREVVKVTELQSDRVTKNILKYMNRLSDALFVMARRANFQLKILEEVWKGGSDFSFKQVMKCMVGLG